MPTVYTAKYTKTTTGYMGQVIEWPSVITEGPTLEVCRFMLKDALNEMILAYHQEAAAIPQPQDVLLEPIVIDDEHVRQTA